MTASTLLNEGITLMLFGMGFVFIFLTLLVIVTTLMSRLITKYEKNVGGLPEGGIPSPTAVIPGNKKKLAHPAEDKTLISILSAAIHTYRSRHK